MSKKTYLVTFINSENLPEVLRANIVTITENDVACFCEFNPVTTFPAEYLQSIMAER